MSQASVPGTASSERDLRQQLVDCIRMLERADIIDYNGHCSIRAGDNRILINTGACTRAALTAADIDRPTRGGIADLRDQYAVRVAAPHLLGG